MDSYTDVRGQCCGSGRRGWDMHNRCCTCPTPACGDAPNMTWPSWDLGSGIAPIPTPYEEPRNVSCPITEAGVLEQNYPVAMAYVPWQQWQTTYAPERGLVQGTIFPELDLIFAYGRCSK